MVDSRRQPPKRPRTLELLVVLALASVYLAFWPLSSRPAAPPPRSPSRGEPVVAVRATEAVWLETLPSSERPPLTLPEGWRLASHDASVPADRPRTSDAPRARRSVVATRRGRIRTRSS